MGKSLPDADGVIRGDFPCVYRGIVKAVDDPEERFRVRAHVIGVYPVDMEVETIPWAEVIPQAGTKFGLYPHFNVEDRVWIMFENANYNYPIVLGGWIASPRGISDVPAEMSADYAKGRNRTLLIDRAGNSIEMSDNPDEEWLKIKSGRAELSVRKTDSSVVINARGPVTVNGNKVNIRADDIVIDGGNTNIYASHATGLLPDGELNLYSNREISVYAGAIPGLDLSSRIELGQMKDGSGVPRQTKLLTIDPSEVQIGKRISSFPLDLPTTSIKMEAVTLIDIACDTTVSIAGTVINLTDAAGILALGAVVTTKHKCAFTGGDHPFGSSIVNAAL